MSGAVTATLLLVLVIHHPHTYAVTGSVINHALHQHGARRLSHVNKRAELIDKIEEKTKKIVDAIVNVTANNWSVAQR